MKYITNRLFIQILFVLFISLTFACCTPHKEKKARAIAKENAHRTTKMLMKAFNKYSGEQAKTKIIDVEYDRYTETSRVKFTSTWMGIPSYNPVAELERHQITGTLISYGDGGVDYEVHSKNQVLDRNQQYSFFMNLFEELLNE